MPVSRAILENSATQTGFKSYYFYNQGYYEPSDGSPGKEDNYEALASYHKRFGDLSLDVKAGGNIRKVQFSQISGSTVDGLSVPDLFTLANSRTTPITFGSGRSFKRVNSLYGTGTLGYKDFLYVDFAARNDWSSALPKDANSYFYPSVGVSFLFSELLGIHDLSFGKLRGSWAQVGSDLGAYQLALNYGVNSNQWNGAFLMGTPDALVDPNIKPSLSSAYEGGLDLKFFSNRLGLSGTYYKEKKIDEILNVPVSATSGFASKNINAGRVDRSGVELTLEVTPVSNRNVNWNMTFNWARNRTKIIELAEGINSIIRETGTFGTSSGARLVHQVGELWGQVRGGGIKRNDAGVPVLDASGQFINVPDTYFGSVLPDFTGGILNEISVGNLFANFNIDFSKGGVFYSLSDHWGKFSGLFEETAALNDKGNPSRDPVAVGGGVHVVGVDAEGKPVDTYVDAQTYWHQFRNKSIAEDNIHPLDFVKLREVNIGYKVNTNKLGIPAVKNLVVSFIARNPWLISSKTKDFDPSEISQSYGENGQFPGTRSFGFNVKVGF